jgi:hypothetical protein
MKKLGILFLVLAFVGAQVTLFAQEKVEKKAEKIEKKGEMMEKKGEIKEHKGEMIEKKGEKLQKHSEKVMKHHPKKGEAMEKKGEIMEKKGEKKEHKGEMMEKKGEKIEKTGEKLEKKLEKKEQKERFSTYEGREHGKPILIATRGSAFPCSLLQSDSERRSPHEKTRRKEEPVERFERLLTHCCNGISEERGKNQQSAERDDRPAKRGDVDRLSNGIAMHDGDARGDEA